MRQKDGRAEAEQTQRRLRAAVIGRARMIRQMSSLLQRPKVQEEKSLVATGDDNLIVFKNFISELDAIYAQTDQVLDEAEFTESSRMGYTPTWTRKRGVEMFDSADKTVLPFGFEETSVAMTRVLMKDRNAREMNDTATVNYNMECPLEPGDTSTLAVHVAVRRYKEPDRLVFVWRALSEGEGSLSGFHADETGWLVLRPQKNASTVLESYVRFVPMDVGDTSDKKVDLDRFAKLVAKTGEEDVKGMMSMLDNMLLGDGLNGTTRH